MAASQVDGPRVATAVAARAELFASSKGLSVRERVALAAVAVGAACYWAACSLLIHRSFHSNGWDLGLIHQVLWNSAHGRPFEYSFRDISYAGDHWQPFLLVLVPVEWVFRDPEAILAVQAFVLAVAVVPLYSAVRRLDLTPLLSIGFVAAYVLSLAVAQAVSFDFHIEAFAPLFAFTALWALTSPPPPHQREVTAAWSPPPHQREVTAAWSPPPHQREVTAASSPPPRQRGGGRGVGLTSPWLFAAMAVLIVTLKEDGAILALALCWVAWFAFRQRAALPIAAVALVYLFVVTSVLIPHFRGDDLNPFAERYGYLGDSPLGVVWGAITHPDVVFEQLTRADSLEAMLVVLASAAFLPLLAPRLLPALALVTLLPLLSQEPGQGALLLHYLLVPSIVALVIGLVGAHNLTSRVKRQGARVGAGSWFTAYGSRSARAQSATLGIVLVLLPLALYAWRSPLPPSFEADLTRFRVDEHARLAQSFVDDIPTHASVSAQSPFVPHLSARAKLFQFPRLAESFYVLLDGRSPVPQEDLNAGFAQCRSALTELGYVILREEDGIQLWHRVRDPQPLVGVPDPCGGLRSWTALRSCNECYDCVTFDPLANSDLRLGARC